MIQLSDDLLKAVALSRGWEVVLQLCDGEKARSTLEEHVTRVTLQRALGRLEEADLIETSLVGWKLTSKGARICVWLRALGSIGDVVLPQMSEKDVTLAKAMGRAARPYGLLDDPE